MTMDQHHHPDDELLAAFAAGEDEGSLATHVDACDRCTALVADLTSLRAALATLPDVATSRPLRFLPSVPASPPPRGFGTIVRRLLAPAMAAGAALVLVGSVGMAASGPLAGASEAGAGGDTQRDNMYATTAAASAASQEGAPALGVAGSSDPLEDRGAEAPTAEPAPAAADQLLANDAPATPWLAITIAGAVLLAAALILRWTVVPRAPDPPAYPGA